jgi:tetratricopeptide (TPR) repeat protein
MNTSTSESGLLGQNVRLFTVKICRPGSAKPVGTGFIVSASGLIATCRHVLAAAGMNPDDGRIIPSGLQSLFPLHDRARASVDVYLPQASDLGVIREARTLQAVFKTGPHPFADDIALLQFEPEVPDLSRHEVAVIGGADGSTQHRFSSFGYRVALDHDSGLPASGELLGSEGKDSDRHQSKGKLRRPIVAMSSQGIRGGMSGAAVLDLEWNLVVGVVQSEYDSGRASKDQYLCFSVNTAVLAEPDFNLALHSGPWPLEPQWKNTVKVDAATRNPKPGTGGHDAPELGDEWIERPHIMKQLSGSWFDDDLRVVALFGFGGTGKSTLARRWIASLASPPEGVFWWNWNLNANVDAFFDAAIHHLTKPDTNLTEFKSPVRKARLLAYLLEGGRFLFVMDGLESVQRQSGDLYGTIQDDALREFLSFFAAPRHRSLCLITTRAPLPDLERFHRSFRALEVDRLEASEGKALLRLFNEKLPEPILDKIVEDWQGHPLSLTLIGGNLRGRDDIMPHQIPVPGTKVGERDRVFTLLRDYDKALSEAERAALCAIALFRGTAPIDGLRLAFSETGEAGTILDQVIDQLVSRRLVQRSHASSDLTEHPLIREYFYEVLMKSKKLGQKLHQIAGHFYSQRAKPPVESPRLHDLIDWIEAVYHSCRGGEFDEAYSIYYDKLEQGAEMVLSWKLNAYSTLVAILEQFFPNGDFNQDPPVADVKRRRFLINRLGVCRMNLGRLDDALPLLEKAIRIAENANLPTEELHSSENVVEVSTYRGQLRTANKYGRQVVELAEGLKDPDELRDALAYHAWSAHLIGELDTAKRAFARAVSVQTDIDPAKPNLMSLYGIWHADHLRQTDELDRAYDLAEGIVAHAEAEDMLDDISQGWRLLGDITAAQGDPNAARKYYDDALRLAREISETTVLLEALSARGRWAARSGDLAAKSDLSEALHYARGGHYSIYEVDIRLGLARIEHLGGDKKEAQRQVQDWRERAKSYNYYWGLREAEALLLSLDTSRPFNKLDS